MLDGSNVMDCEKTVAWTQLDLGVLPSFDGLSPFWISITGGVLGRYGYGACAGRKQAGTKRNPGQAPP